MFVEQARLGRVWIQEQNKIADFQKWRQEMAWSREIKYIITIGNKLSQINDTPMYSKMIFIKQHNVNISL